MTSFWENKTVLITGGTGAFGSAWVEYALKNLPEINKIIIFSRDEFKQYEVQQKLKFIDGFLKVKCEIGDIRDASRIAQIIRSCDIILHASALKHVPLGEIFPSEFIKTNIGGAENLINACESCLDGGIKKVIALSTSKAVVPLNLYGATKLCSDKLFLAQNERNIENNGNKYSVVRFGNIFNSRGSVVPLFQQQKLRGKLTLTDPNMSRFTITIEQACEFATQFIEKADGGEIFIPKSPSYTVGNLAKAIAPVAEWELIGLRLGEKLHEELITESDSPFTFETNNHYRILNPNRVKDFENKEFKKVNIDFSFSSNNNPQQLTVNEIREFL